MYKEIGIRNEKNKLEKQIASAEKNMGNGRNEKWKKGRKEDC